MKKYVVLLLFPLVAIAQPEPDPDGIAAAFAALTTTVSSGEFPDVAELIACPAENVVGELEISTCDLELVAHVVRVDRMVQRVKHYFPGETVALDPHYGAEAEGEEEFHLLLFADLASTPYVLVAFSEVAGTYRVTNIESDENLPVFTPPHSVVEAFNRIVETAENDEIDIESFAELIVARGDDENRNWSTFADPHILKEAAFVERTLERIRLLLANSRGDFEIQGYVFDEESEGEWNVLHVRFDTHESEEVVSFGFLPVGNSFLLGDID